MKLVAVHDDVLSVLLSMSFHWVIVYIIHNNLFLPFSTLSHESMHYLPLKKCCFFVCFFVPKHTTESEPSLSTFSLTCFHLMNLVLYSCNKRILIPSASCKGMVHCCSLIRTNTIKFHLVHLALCSCEKKILMPPASCKGMVHWCSLIRILNICQYTILSLYPEAYNSTNRAISSLV